MSNAYGGVIQLGSVVEALYGSDRSFAQSLLEQYSRRGSLSEKQVNCIPRLIEKAEANVKRANAPKPQVENFHRVIEIFDYAKESKHKTKGLKKPKIQFGTKMDCIELKTAPDSGANAGMVYVTRNGDYKGKISREGKFTAYRETDEDLVKKLGEFSMDPKEITKRYGFSTGLCSMCGRDLTDPVSIANGIGPICQANYGF